MRIYLSGPMGGIEDFNVPEFARIAERLRDAGYTVINPGENFGGDNSHPREVYMRYDLAQVLAAAEAIVMIPGWTRSEGAQTELAVAHAIGLKLYEWGDAAPVPYINLNPLKMVDVVVTAYPAYLDTTRGS